MSSEFKAVLRLPTGIVPLVFADEQQRLVRLSSDGSREFVQMTATGFAIAADEAGSATASIPGAGGPR